MPSFHAIDRENLHIPGWEKINESHQLFDEAGQEVESANFRGRQFQLFLYARDTPLGDKIGFILLVILSLGLALVSQYIYRALFWNKESKLLGVCINPTFGIVNPSEICDFFREASHDQLYYIRSSPEFRSTMVALRHLHYPHQFPFNRINDFDYKKFKKEDCNAIFLSDSGHFMDDRLSMLSDDNRVIVKALLEN